MNFDMNVFMNALQAGFGAGNTAKAQAPAEQKEENLFEDVKPAAKNQTQQPQVAQTQQSMGFFAMVGMMFLGMFSFLGFGNNANNNVNNNVNNNANNATIYDEQKTDEQKLDKLYANAKQGVHLEKMDVKNAFIETKQTTMNVDKIINKIKKANYNKQCDDFKASNPDVAEILTLEDAKAYKQNQLKTLKGISKMFADLGLATMDEKPYIFIYYLDKNGEFHSTYADPKARELSAAEAKANREYDDYVKAKKYYEKAQKENKNVGEFMKDDPKLKELWDKRSAALDALSDYLDKNNLNLTV